MIMWLLIDDQRDLNTDIIARTYEAGVTALQCLPIKHLVLDFDLGEAGSDKCGLDVLRTCKDCLPKHVQIVSMNPIGRVRMAGFLTANGYTTSDETNFNK